jgi:hypothetical protein
MIIREVAEFRIEDLLFKLAKFSYHSRSMPKTLEIDEYLLILAQQSKTFSWIPIDAIKVYSTDIQEMIKSAKMYFLWKSVDCMKNDFKEYQASEKFYENFPKGIKGEQLIEPEYVFTFGEYKGTFIKEVLKTDPEYVLWNLANNSSFKDQFEDLVGSFYEEQEEDEDE